MATELALPPGTVEQLIARTLRVPAFAGPSGNGEVVARQLDVALLSEGFVAPADLLAHLAGLRPGAAFDAAVRIVGAVKRRIGSHVESNPYFIDFPARVPRTERFWAQCLAASGVDVDRAVVVDLLTLPGYGRYRHSFAQMLARREQRPDSPDDRRTRLALGGSLDDEARRAYGELAGATTPPTAGDLALLADLAAALVDEALPEDVPVRENRATIDSARLAAGRPLALCSTVTDVLRVAVRASGGDVVLARRSRIRSFARRERRVLLAALDAVVAARPSSLADVSPRRERWKRLGERLHPHEHAHHWPQAARVFAVARGEEVARSTIARAESASASGDAVGAADALVPTPGVLLRWADRLLRTAGSEDQERVADRIGDALPAASGRLLYALRSHLENADRPNPERVFVTRTGRPHFEPETRDPLPLDAAVRLADLVDDEIARRLPAPGTLVVDPAVLPVALPISGKATADGHAVLPRGTTSLLPERADVLRLFVHWRQAACRTDFDLSLLLLDDRFDEIGQVSWTNLEADGVVHSGDVIDAADGATEFIDVTLADVAARHVVPQVLVYAGEGFDEVVESMFGYMTHPRDRWWHQAPPFDPRAVRARSELRGPGRIALPLAFTRGYDGWRATWMHLLLRGRPEMNQVETAQVTTSSLVRDAVTRRVLTVRHLVDLLGRQADRVIVLPESADRVEGLEDGPVTYLGLEPVAGLPADAESITLDRLASLIPA